MGNLLGRMGVVSLFFGKIAEQLPNVGVSRAPGGHFIELLCFEFHPFGRLLDGSETERPNEPDRPPLQEATDILPADQRHMIAKSLFVELQQTMAMAILVAPHLTKFVCLLWISVLQAIRK